jgi:allophanate hydrolase
MTQTMHDLRMTLPGLRAAYDDGLAPAELIAEVYRRIATVDDPSLFIHLRDAADVRAEAAALPARSDATPLWGVPYVVKDNIDVAGLPTTAACPAYAYTPAEDAFVVARLRAAGAIVIGKTNLDQFATGLVGVRSPYGIPRNAVDPTLVPGGSSSGSAVAVGHGLVAFSLGTDTAGSGRVPAALNNIVGLKPSLGALSARGVVPACRTLDTISIFAARVADAHAVFAVACAPDPADAYSRAIAAAPLARRRRACGSPCPTRRPGSSLAIRSRPPALTPAWRGWRRWGHGSWRSISRRSMTLPGCSTRAPGSPNATRLWKS